MTTKQLKDQTCRFCQKTLLHHGTRGQGKVAIHMYWCDHCQSEQTFDSKAKTIEWSFMAGEAYCIHFWPKFNSLKIVEYENGRPKKYVLELELDQPPDHMTPQTMTEEKVKTLIVFS